MTDKDLIIIGGGPAGLAAAIAAREQGMEDILILEREQVLGGILNQCIHNGFGLHTFKEELTGPEYAGRFTDRVREMGIPFHLGTMVLSIDKDKKVTAVSEERGLEEYKAKAIILAMGCRERPRGALSIPGSRCAGVFTAGTAQKIVNLYGEMPGKRIVILGSGDIGLIMARRMTLEGAKVEAVVELMPYSTGLRRNIVQCLDDFDIPLYYSHTVTRIKGEKRVEGVTIAQVDDARNPIPGTQREIPCDTLLLSVGLIPENELSRGCGVELSPVTGGPLVNESLQTEIDGVFACGNALHVHDLVDYVSSESALAGRQAARYLKGEAESKEGSIAVLAGNGVRYTVPATVTPSRLDGPLDIRLRVGGVYKDCTLCVDFDSERVMTQKKRIMTPGEMETVTIPLSLFQKYPGCTSITVKVEEGSR